MNGTPIVLSFGTMWKGFPMMLLAACAAPTPDDGVEGIRAAMAEQEAAWDRGDIPGFMEWYADSACFVNPERMTCGKDAVTANYLRSYPDKAAMGDLSFGIQEILPAGDRHAWLTGTWQLVRSTDTVGGAYSLLWRSEAQGWRILRDHTY